MSRIPADNLTAEKIKQLVAAARAESIEDAKHNAQAFEHDWRQPCYFGRHQLTKLGQFAEGLAKAASERFTQFYQSDFDVTANSISQHFVGEFVRRAPDEEKSPEFFLLFGAAVEGSADIKPWGFAGIPHSTALIWTSQSLGQAGSGQDAAETLSQLENSLLLDIAALLIEALAESYGNKSIRVIGNIVSGRFPLDVEKTKEICKITLNTKNADSQDDPAKAYLSILCDKLGPVVKTVQQDAVTLSGEQASKAIMSHLSRLPVPVSVQLGSAAIAFGQLMNLAPHDVLVLDTKVSEPATLIADGLQLFHARPAKSEGKYAVVITGPTLANRRS